MFRQTWYCGNAYGSMALKLLFALVLLSLSRILIYFFNPSLFEGIGFTHLLFVFFAGFRFDLVTLVLLNSPLIFFNSIPLSLKYNGIYQSLLNILFYITNSLALATNFIDVIYFRFSQKRMTIDIFNYIDEHGTDIISLIPVFIRDFWFPFLLWIFFIVLLVWASRKIRTDETLKDKYKLKNYFFDLLRFAFILVLYIIIGRGGLQHRPINIINAGDYTEPKYFPVLLNTPFTLVKTKDKIAVEPKIYFSNKEELDGIFTPIKSFNQSRQDFKQLNVVIIILESFTAEHSAFLNPNLEQGNYPGYTPFFDSLMQNSLVFKGYANGEKSIDGIPAILSAIPSLMTGPYITSLYAGNSISSIAGLLKTKGYSGYFFHGGTNGTMGFESYAKIAGFDHYCGRNEYNDEQHFDGKWGIFDEEFLQYSANVLNEAEEPFVAAIFTLSSHHPYKIPDKYKGRFPKGKLDIHESIGYTDFALNQFFKSISVSGWFNNTLFVLTADHTYQGYYPYYKTTTGKYSIPIVFYQHGHLWNDYGTNVVQQTDILPSVLDYLGYDDDFIAFGQSVFDPVARHFAVSNLYGIYQLISDGYVLKFDGEKDIGLYHLETDSLLTNNLMNQQDSVQKSLSNLIKAIKQQYDFRVVNNKLIIK